VFSTFDFFSHGYYIASGSEKITSLDSTDKGIAYAEVDINDSKFIEIIPKGPGTCTITAHGEGGGTLTFPVKVTKAFFLEEMKEEMQVWNDIYGSRKINVEVFNIPGVKVSLKIGKKKYKTRVTGSNYRTSIKLVKVYPLNTKYTMTFNYKGIKITRKDKLSSGTWVDGWSRVSKKSKKKIKISILNLHKGDVVKVKYKGRTYSSSKAKRNCAFGTTTDVTVKTKKNFSATSKFRVWVVNKDKKRLCRDEVIKLNNWYYDPYEDDEY
jgi:hypothetical protein